MPSHLRNGKDLSFEQQREAERAAERAQQLHQRAAEPPSTAGLPRLDKQPSSVEHQRTLEHPSAIGNSPPSALVGNGSNLPARDLQSAELQPALLSVDEFEVAARDQQHAEIQHAQHGVDEFKTFTFAAAPSQALNLGHQGSQASFKRPSTGARQSSSLSLVALKSLHRSREQFAPPDGVRRVGSAGSHEHGGNPVQPPSTSDPTGQVKSCIPTSGLAIYNGCPANSQAAKGNTNQYSLRDASARLPGSYASPRLSGAANASAATPIAFTTSTIATATGPRANASTSSPFADSTRYWTPARHPPTNLKQTLNTSAASSTFLNPPLRAVPVRWTPRQPTLPEEREETKDRAATGAKEKPPQIKLYPSTLNKLSFQSF
ncbi:hypothetical protein PCANC_18383 [Puccinia coronata f. sp. avenae]|uniref:Uncharacterized protein n=1 Tax=Puccinia coronata f. sp. avenae TaxID=200324 RepID=A0A2N5V1H3_9BASI|nr:hypothetical protein PCANC_27364 [Puccinia coronata f. sp. avenae]PLW43797.1 hypothetical protein PCANC_18383 [Puccinia coronata f. sp. avenae]